MGIQNVSPFCIKMFTNEAQIARELPGPLNQVHFGLRICDVRAHT